MPKSPVSRHNRWQRNSQILGWLCLALGLLALAGRFGVLFDFPNNWHLGNIMKVNTALLLMGIAICLLFLHRQWTKTGHLGLIFILLITPLTLWGYAGGTEWKIENGILNKIFLPAFTATPERLPLMTAINIMVLAVALLTVSLGWYLVGQFLAAFLFILAYASLIGNLYNIDGFHAQESFSGISTQTALTVALLSLGILLYRPANGWMKMVSSKYSGGLLTRTAVSYFLLVAPIFIGFYMYSLSHWHLTPGLGILSLFILSCLITLPFIYYFLQRLNTLDARLQKAHHKLQIANTGLSARNLELSEALADVKAGNRELALMTKEVLLSSQALEIKNKELSRLNQSLDYIVHMASHDLKTPVYNLELLLKELKPALEPHMQPDEARLVTMVGNSIFSLKSTIEGLTQIIKSQQLILGLQVTFSLTKLIQEIRKELEREIQQNHAQIEKHLQIDTVVFSRIHLRSVLFNLLSNALKYRAPDRPLKITISTKAVPVGIEIDFADNGLGMSESQLCKLFTIYKRFHSHIDGSGIGLYLVKQTIENNGGTIRVESTEGAGTRFIIFLPQNKK